MGKTMDPKSVIYGHDTKISPKEVKWSEIENCIAQFVGPLSIPGLAKAKALVNECKDDKDFKKAYVKVGLIGSNLVLRVKVKGKLLDTERDEVLMPKFEDKKRAYALQKLDAANQQLEMHEPLDFSAQEQFLEQRTGYVALTNEVAERFKNFLTQAKQLVKDGPDRAGELNGLIEQVQQEFQNYRNSPEFLNSRGSLPACPVGTPGNVKKGFEKRAKEAFYQGMRTSDKLNQRREKILICQQDMQALVEEAGGNALDADAAIEKLVELRNAHDTIENSLSKIDAETKPFNFDANVRMLQKLVAAQFDIYEEKRAEFAARYVTVTQALNRLNILLRRVNAIPNVSAAVEDSKADFANVLQARRIRLEEILATRNNFETLVAELNQLAPAE